MKALKIFTIILTIFSALLITMSGIMKLAGLEDVVRTLTQMGLENYIKALGVMEILFVVLFLISKTRKLGFILLSCYFSGAIATELSHDGNYLSPVFPLILIWVSAYLRDKSIFLTSKV
jgi:uncharacterized membrane protein YphA (DoxX/SURF4 family)